MTITSDGVAAFSIESVTFIDDRMLNIVITLCGEKTVIVFQTITKSNWAEFDRREGRVMIGKSEPLRAVVSLFKAGSSGFIGRLIVYGQ